MNNVVMKKILYMLAATAIVMAAAGCSKEHQCKCEIIDAEYIPDNDYRVFIVDGSISCEDITEMSFEERYATESSISVHHVDVLKVKCRDYGN